MEDIDHLTSLTLTRYLPRLSSHIPNSKKPSSIPFDQTKPAQPNPKKIHGRHTIRANLPGRSRSDLYRVEGHIVDYQDVFLDRSWNFPKLKIDAQRLKKANAPYITGKLLGKRQSWLMKPHHIPVLRELVKHRVSGFYCCDYCDDKNRDLSETARKAMLEENLRERRRIAGDKSWRLPFEDERDGRRVFGNWWMRMMEEFEANQTPTVEGEIGDCEAVQRVGFGFEDIVKGEGQWEYQIQVKPRKRGRERGRKGEGRIRDTSPATSEEWVGAEDLGDSWALVMVAVENGSRSSDSVSYSILTPTSESVSDQWEVLSEGV
ncbi:hypothetical protein B0T21DRAFT_296118 [Apiosordaria backusii]|uniref:Uncharacterized protein n=1 Tax=Apiosordaria backusii TaxID=314023 RepID=A0AA40AIW9_9PEZI|nr:hypothetical protein B0T21DRAFT_296118 [Apiosordaria backusii]